MDQIIHLKETSSTNDYLSELLKSNPEEGTTVFADFQTSGKGQSGNKWSSKESQNLTFSMLLYPDFLEANQQFIISQIASLAIINILKTNNIKAEIKWPNDIYVGNEKIAGILIENCIDGNKIASTIIGIGLNINQEIFPKNLKNPTPTSMIRITNKSYSKCEILYQIREQIINLYNVIIKGDFDSIRNNYKLNLFRRNGYYPYKTINGDLFYAKINNILPTGILILELKSGKIIDFNYKEIKFIL